jgi:hypothetical protein
VSKIAIICLGALGDCCNALPLALHEFQQGNHVTFYIAREFASLLDGVTYVEPAVVDTHYSNCLPVAEAAERTQEFDRVMVVQCYGTPVERQTDSYCKEAWRLVGKMHLWGKLPLVFDNRTPPATNVDIDPEIEDKRNRPILIFCHSGRSSPFPFRRELLALMESLKKDFEVWDLSEVRMQHFYDLLHAFRVASCLIATDSGPLHLANAVPSLPVIALVTDRPDMWHGSPSQPNHVLRIRYGDFPKKESQDRIIETLMQIVSKKKIERRIVHVWNDYPYRQQDAGYRHGVAKASWEQEYKKGRWIPCPIPDAQLPRTAQSVGESKPLPFVNDIINIAAEQAQPDDLICLTNDDTIFVSDLTERLLNTEPPFWSSRWEHAKVNGPLNAQSIKNNSWKHVGADIFVFTKRWWMEHGGEFPDFIVAREQWDLIMRSMINLRGGHEEDALCAHIIHEPEWHSAQFRESVGNLFNRESAQRFVRANQLKWPIV